MAKKQYLDLAGLTTYDEEIKAHIDEIASGKANSSHNHAASNITSGTLSSDRLPTVPVTKGGTGSTTAAGALTNLGITATAAELNKLDGVTATTTELNYVDGVTSNIQSQLDSLSSDLDDHTHSGSDITSGTVAAARLPVASASAAGIVNTDTQSFKGAKTFTSSVTVAGLKTPTANTGDIGTSSMPFDGVYAKDLCIAPQVSGGSAIQAGRFTVDRVGTTTTNGLTRLEIGNYIQSGQAGNAEGYLEIYNKVNGSVTLRTSHEDDNNFYIELPEHSGTLLTDDDAYAKDETYSKDELEWTQIYDSGSITNKVNSIFVNNISGYKKFRVAVKCVNSANSTARAGSTIFKATDGTLYQFPIWTNLFTTSASTSAGMAEFEVIDGYLVCPNATRSIKTSNFISPTEGGTADNLVATGSGIIKCSKTLSNLIISSLDQDSSFYFGVGSRVIVWGCMA